MLLLDLCVLFPPGRFRVYRQAKKSGEYQQLQLQGGKRGADFNYHTNIISKLKELSLPELILFFPPDPAEAQQAVCPRRPLGQEEQEAAAEVAAEHGGAHRGPGAAADPVREGNFGQNSRAPLKR